MERYLSIIFFTLLFSCSTEEDGQKIVLDKEVINDIGNSIEIPSLDIVSKVDSIFYQNVFQMENGQYIAIAEPVNDRFEGLCLQLLEMAYDSSMNVIASSSYGYDSRTYFPTFFKQGKRTFLLVNTGERDSWGNKVMELTNKEFKEFGFIDVAKATRNRPGEDHEFRHENIARFSILSDNEPLTLTFTCDSIILFDDQKSALDTLLSSDQVKYVLKEGQLALETKY
ncbi:MAG: hypothetical protein HKN39_01765 [Flavobacteriales bacterium]|nr:hypothetical protein [Flavobacteriales bacterium]